MSNPYGILKEEYIALRAEIHQSIAKQHQITLAGYGVTFAIFGYIITMRDPIWQLLAIVPIALVAMTSLWTVECNRMVRASYYIGYILWPKITEIAGSTSPAGWETWIRQETGHASDFCKRQNSLQLLVQVSVPVMISGAVMVIMTFLLWGIKPSYIMLPFIVLFWVAITGLWIYVYLNVSKVANLIKIKPEEDKDIIDIKQSRIS